MTNTSKPTNNNTAENKTAQQIENKAKKNTEKDKQSSGKNLSIASIILVLLIGGGLAYRGQQIIQTQNATINSLQNKLTQVTASLQQNIKTVSQQTSENISNANQMLRTGLAKNNTVIEQQSADIKGLQKVVTELQGRTPNDWLITETDYLTKMAGRKLWLEHDVASAVELLKSADIRIAELNDPSLTSVRKAFAEDITTLSALPRVDRDGLVLRIASLEDQLKSLPIDGALLPQAELETKTEVSDSLDNWKENIKTSLKQFSENFITYRKRDGSVIPLLSPVQHFYVQENIKSKLETAVTNVYREQPKLYKQALRQAKDWALEFYNKEDPGVQSFIATLEKLEDQLIDVKYPDSLKSPLLITQLIEQRLRNKVISINNNSEEK